MKRVGGAKGCIWETAKKEFKNGKKKLPRGVVIFLLIALVLALFYLDNQLQDSTPFSVLTGMAVQTEGMLSEENSVAVSVSDVSIAADTPVVTDIQVWQGQYYKGTEFQVGTFEFNFTVYDAAVSGTACYSNLTTITTGNFGEWRTEQNGVGIVCNDATKNYYLEITINNKTQSPKRLIKSFNYLRKDSNEELKGQVKITSSVKGGTSQPASLTLSNTITEKTTSTSFRLQNEIGKFIAISMGSNKTSFGGIKGNQGTISYTGGNIFSFSALNTPASWLWRITMAPTLTTVIIDKLMELTKTGSLILYHGNLDVNGSINATGNIITSQNITSNYATAITGLFSNLNTTNVTAVQYNSVDAGESKTGLTSSQFRVCKKFKVPDNTCEEWCKLEITGGIITNCK